MTPKIDINRPEKVIFEKKGVGSAPASIRRAVTHDPDLPDGPYRTLHLYAEYARQKDKPSIREVAEARGKTPRTLFNHRQTLIALNYLEIVRDDDGAGTVIIKNPARLPRLKEYAATLVSAGVRPPLENEEVLLQKLKHIRPDFHAAGGRKLLQSYRGKTPIDELLDQWVAHRRYIPPTWRVGMVYREIEAGNPPPASPLQSDPEMAAAFKAGERHAAEIAGE